MANSLCALIQPSALGLYISPTSSASKPSHDFNTPIKTDTNTEMGVEAGNGSLVVMDNKIIEIKEDDEEEGERKDLVAASRFFLPKKSQKEIIKSRSVILQTNHSTPPFNDVHITPERSLINDNLIDRSTKRPREESFSTPQSRKSLDRSVMSNQNQTLPATSTSTSTATLTSTPVCAPHVITPDDLPSFLSSCIPTSKHFHAQVKSTFECLHCGFFREPKMVRSTLPLSLPPSLPPSLHPSFYPPFLPLSLPLSLPLFDSPTLPLFTSC